MVRKILHLFANGDKIELPNLNSFERVSVLYVHVEFEKQTTKGYTKLCANFVSISDNIHRVICGFYQPPRVKDTVYTPQHKQTYDVMENSDMAITVVTSQENKVARCYVQLEVHD